MHLFLWSSSEPLRVLSSFSKSLYASRIIYSFPAPTTSINMQFHAFAGNPLKSCNPKLTNNSSPTLALEALKEELTGSSSHGTRVLPFRKGKPLTFTTTGDDGSYPTWHLGLIPLLECQSLFRKTGAELTANSLVYLGSKSIDNCDLWAVDVSREEISTSDMGQKQLSFIELRTLMVATDWSNVNAMGDLAIAGHAKSLLEWHNVSRYCGHCGNLTVAKEAGRRKVCTNEQCKKTIYPRVDLVVIMLVIDRQNDRVLLSRQARYVPRLWSCLAGFVEPGESLEEAVRRETMEETGIEVGEVVYHSSQPWPVGPSGVPCQQMVGFFAYANSFDVKVDKSELEDAEWHTREEVEKALNFAEYKKAQRAAAVRVEKICNGVEKGQNISSDFNVESGELAQMFFPGPFAIAHHLISSWVTGSGAPLNHRTSSL